MGNTTSGKRPSAKYQIALAACLANPELPSRTVARDIHTQNPLIFSSVEDARCVVRYIRGNMGECHRHMAHPKVKRPNGTQNDIRQLPPGLRQGHKTIEFNEEGRTLIFGDWHSPYHDARAIEVAVQTGIAEGCESCYLNGDGGDFYSISDHEKNPLRRDLQNELDTLERLLTEVGVNFKRKTYKCGNHDEWWARYIWKHASEFAGLTEFELPVVLGLADLGWTWIESKQLARFGKLNVLHGHEFKQSFAPPVNAARGLWLRLSNTAACNHWHSSSHHSETLAIDKAMVSCWSIGCLCDLYPEYSPLNKWNLGFAIVEVKAGGAFQLSNYKIDPKTYKVYRA